MGYPTQRDEWPWEMFQDNSKHGSNWPGGTLQPWRSSWGTEYGALSATFLLQSALETSGGSQHPWQERPEGETLLGRTRPARGSVRKTRLLPPRVRHNCRVSWADSLFLLHQRSSGRKPKQDPIGVGDLVLATMYSNPELIQSFQQP